MTEAEAVKLVRVYEWYHRLSRDEQDQCIAALLAVGGEGGGGMGKPLFSAEDWESIVKMVAIIRDHKADDEDRISAGLTLAEIVMNEPLEVFEMDLGEPPQEPPHA